MLNMHTEETCRVCLSGSTELTPLRVRLPDRNKTFEETINFVVNINIVLENGLPDKICKDCGTMLDVADTFKQRCLESEAMLGQLDKEKRTGEFRPKFEDKTQENSKIYSEDASCLPTVVSCSSLSDSLGIEVKNEENIDEFSKHNIKIEIVEEENVDNAITTTEHENLDNMQDFEAPLSQVKEEFSIKEESVEIPVKYADSKDILLEPMKHLQLLHHSCMICGRDFPSRESFEFHRKDERCSKNSILDDIQPSTSGITAATQEQEATNYLTEKREKKAKLDKQKGRKTTEKITCDKKNTLTKSRTLTVEKLFICNECNKQYKLKQCLETHMRIHMGHVPDPYNYSCNVCEKKFKRKLQLENHIRTHTGDKPYSCSICEKKFSQKVHLDYHVKIHSGYKPYSCDVCKKNFSRKRNLDKHKLVHSDQKPYPCTICEKQFRQKNRLEVHIRTHKGEKPYTCNVCFKNFGDKNTLLIHERIHTGVRPFSCNVCDKKFTQKPHLDSHIRIHTGEKPYSCNVCEKKFKRKLQLENHIRTHTGDKPYSCSICAKKFSQKVHLDSHVKIHSGYKPYSCDVCKKNFSRKRNLDKHKLVHSDQKP